MSKSDCAIGGLMIGCIAIGAASAIGIESMVHKWHHVPRGESIALVEHEWDAEKFMESAEALRRSERIRTRESEAFKKALADIHDRISDAYTATRSAQCLIETESLQDASLPMLVDCLCDELRRRGFDVRRGASVFSKGELIDIRFPRHTWSD